jgi:hypothetical protein
MPTYTDPQIRDALTTCKGMVYVAAARLGCSPNTIKARLEKSPALQAVLDDAAGMADDLAELKLFEAVQAGQPWAIQFFLKTKGKSRGYTERCEQSAVVAQVPVDPEHARVRVAQMLEELAKRRDADLRRRGQLTEPAEIEASGEVIEVVRQVEPAPP